MSDKKIELVVCYIRVSSQEQKLHGISLDAQRDKLKEYADKHGLKIVGWYEDEGVSGRKLIKNRPALQRMLKDAQAGKFHRILFIKLDRFFRSVAEYHECMKLIDPVIWTATEEKYDLSTANGRAFVNMKLTIAELEADQTGERIRIVNDYKVKTGQALTGSHNQGIAYTVAKIDGVKRVVKRPEYEELVMDYLHHFITYQNKMQALTYVMEKYNVELFYNSVAKLLTDTRVYGHYRGNDNYCEPYITKAEYDKIQEILKKNIKKTPSKNVYLFTGLIKCPKCGRILISVSNSRNKPTFSYRCSYYIRDKICSYNKCSNERKIEAALLDRFDIFMSDFLEEYKIKDARVRDSHATDKIKDIKAEMERTTKAYRKGRITEAEYDKEYDELEARLQELQAHLEPVVERDLTQYEELLKSDWRDLYNALTRENKRAFWRKYIKEIQIGDNSTVKRVIFF